MKALVKVKEILVEILGVDESQITIESRFSDLGADSLDVIRLVVELEKEYSISIPDKRVEEFCTIKDLIRYMSNTLKMDVA
ncbi:MAG: acyl carrier protein [Paludibacteraceae bacterium]|nr:acyl carrier protein [Paludibacteraceae bacterium]